MSHSSTVGPSGRRALRRVAVAGRRRRRHASCSPAAPPRTCRGSGCPTRPPSRATASCPSGRASWIAAFVVGALVWGLILWAIIFHRRRSETDVPVQTRYNVPIEILYTVVPLMIVLVLFFYTARDEAEITSARASRPTTP